MIFLLVISNKQHYLSPFYTWAHVKYQSTLYVCTRAYKHTPTHHSNTRKSRKIYKTKPLSLHLPKHSPQASNKRSP